MTQVSGFRLYLMRAFYLVILLGVGSMALPALIDPADPLDPVRGVAYSFWAALALLAAFGLRYPLQMVPVLLIQMAYKTLWLLAVALPLWSAGTPFDPVMVSFTWAMAVGVALDLIVIPWGYFFANYVQKAGDPWTLRRAAARAGAVADV